MEIINAKMANEMTLDSRKENEDRVITDYFDSFNNQITKAARRGDDSCVIPWTLFGLNSALSEEDFNHIATFISILMDNDYEVAYYYSNPRHHDVSGIIVAWGNNAEMQINSYFNSKDSNYYRGEENGLH